ncbi:MAG: hypothetical protein EVG15_06960 [Candidatus Acididesulfobacter diazotrophicus]|jgi:hypothetical protein|uniref:Uncharacterized protein n=1 Tax=Candidatus Acididesulfobacter diazotrophicus TaxID=2597226 RepID=A0A519BLN9_9DELT|nr:MAG: hypothetical protein EVG15_06960 [Candidatus Acididesulfobacter diazotrophicus]
MKTAAKFDFWVYSNFPDLLAIVEIFQIFLVKKFPILRKFFDYMDDRPDLDAIIPKEKRRRIERAAVNNLLRIFKKVVTKKAIKII